MNLSGSEIKLELHKLATQQIVALDLKDSVHLGEEENQTAYLALYEKIFKKLQELQNA